MINPEPLQKFFEGFLLEEPLECPTIQMDMPEAAIDHFDVRDDFDEVTRVYIASQQFIKSKQSIK